MIVRDFRRLAETGAAVVFGSQAHWAHPFEVHYGAFVHYGAGNFIFDQSWPDARDGTVLWRLQGIDTGGVVNTAGSINLGGVTTPPETLGRINWREVRR